MTNQWIQTNQKILEVIKRTCLEHDMKGGYGGNVPLQHIIRLFDSVVIEINRLQKENDELKAKVKKNETSSQSEVKKEINEK